MENNNYYNRIVELPSDFIDPSLKFCDYLKLKILKEYEIEDDENLNELISNATLEDIEKANSLKNNFLEELMESNDEKTKEYAELAYYGYENDENTNFVPELFIKKHGYKTKESLIAYIFLTEDHNFKYKYNYFSPEYRENYYEFISQQTKTRSEIKNVLDIEENNDDQKVYNLIKKKLEDEDVIIFRPCAINENIEQFFVRYPNVSKIIFADPMFSENEYIKFTESSLKKLDENYKTTKKDEKEIVYEFLYNNKKVILQIFIDSIQTETLKKFPKFNVYEQGGVLNLPNGGENSLSTLNFFEEMFRKNLLEHSFVIDIFNHANMDCYREFVNLTDSTLYGLPQHFTPDDIGNGHAGLKPMYKTIIEVKKSDNFRPLKNKERK